MSDDKQIQEHNFEQYGKQRLFFVLRGFLMLIFGVLFSTMALLNPDIRIMSGHYSWLPLVAFLLLLIGILGLADAIVSRKSDVFLLNILLAIFDVVTSVIILAEIDNDPVQLILLVAAYLMTRSLFRIAAAFSVKFPHSKAIFFNGLLGLVMGVLLWLQWPISTVSSISFYLSLELAVRGWSLMVFGLWLNKIRGKRV